MSGGGGRRRDRDHDTVFQVSVSEPKSGVGTRPRPRVARNAFAFDVDAGGGGGDSISLEPAQLSEDNESAASDKVKFTKQFPRPKQKPQKQKQSHGERSPRNGTGRSPLAGGAGVGKKGRSKLVITRSAASGGRRTHFKGDRNHNHERDRDRESINSEDHDGGVGSDQFEGTEDGYEDEDGLQGKPKTSSALLLGDQDTTSLLESGIKSRNIFNLTIYQPPMQRTHEQIDAFEKLLYVPTSAPVPIEEKLTHEKTPRNLEDEGIFHGEPIPISGRNQNRLEQRIMKENRVAWFDQDGRMSAVPDPRRQRSQRFFYDEPAEEAFQKRLKFVPAKVDLSQRFQLDSGATYELSVDISSIAFTHHPLFSKEHVLAYKLDTLFSEYKKRQELGTTERAKNKLKALREVLVYTKSTKSELQQKFDDGLELSVEEQTQLTQIENRLADYRQEMRKARLERDQSLWDDKNALMSTLDTWKSLKALRAQQEYSNTTLKLNIITIQENLENDRAIWVDELNQEFEDIKDEYEADYEAEYRAYQERGKIWAHEKRQRARSKEVPMRDGDGSDEDESLMDDDASLSAKPEPPPKFDAKKTREGISKRFRQLHRAPGEPRIMLEMATAPITPTHELPKGAETEIARRTILDSNQLKIRVLFNGKEVYRSRKRELRSDFSATFGFVVPITINEWPRSLSLTIWEYGNLGKRCYGEIRLAIPNSKTSIDSCASERIPFTSDAVIKLTANSGVGSGAPFEISGVEHDGVLTSGFGIIRVGWSQDNHGRFLAPKYIEESLDLSEGTKTGDSTQIAQDSQLDPNDPKNARWLSAQAHVRHTSDAFATQQYSEAFAPRLPDEFVLDGLMQQFDFCTTEALNNMRRIRLLQLRDEEVPEYKNYKMIAPFDEDIPLHIFNDHKRKVARRDPSFEDPDRIGADTNNNRLAKIREIRHNIMQLFESSSKQLTFEDLVIEEQIPDIGTLGLNLMSLFQPRRALRPERKERKKIQIGTSLIEANVNLVVNIVRATNLPMKRVPNVNSQGLSTEALTGVSLFKKDVAGGILSPVKPFVEISFRRTAARTITSVGTNPIWNQEIQLPLPDVLGSGQLAQTDDNIYILVYDEVEIDILEDDRRRETDIHQRLEKRWLGSVTIPFSTLYINGRIEGTFKINSPSVLLGYEYQTVGGPGGVAAFGPNSARQVPRKPSQSQEVTMGQPPNHAFITFFITLQPTISPAVMSKRSGSSGESPEVLSHVQVWENKILQRYPTRKLKALVMNSAGETILATRYLQEIEPPHALVGHENTPILETMFSIAHFVSLFPTVRSSSEATSLSLWLPADVFVGTPGGGVDEQAILLACYFMHLGVPCWLLFGNAVLDGPTTYVLTSFKNTKSDDERFKGLKNETLIWNPSTGECFNVNGTFCPLQQAWSIIGKSNIWGNISDLESPQHIDWNFEKSAQWLPLFSKAVDESKLPSVQPLDRIRYDKVDKTRVSRLTQQIERNLKESFMIWRKTSKTNWNRHCSAILKRILPKLEQREVGRLGPMEIGSNSDLNPGALLRGSESGGGIEMGMDDESLGELRDIMSSYQMTGFPLQQCYTSLDVITETVYATSLHSIDTPNVEFALAVYVKGYPANLFSVWIYLAALHKRK